MSPQSLQRTGFQTIAILICTVVATVLGGCATGCISSHTTSLSRWEYQFNWPSGPKPQSIPALGNIRNQDGHYTVLVSGLYKRGDVKLDFDDQAPTGTAVTVAHKSSPPPGFHSTPVTVRWNFDDIIKENSGNLKRFPEDPEGTGILVAYGDGGASKPNSHVFWVYYKGKNGSLAVAQIPYPSHIPIGTFAQLRLMGWRACYLVAVPFDLATAPIQAPIALYHFSRFKFLD